MLAKCEGCLKPFSKHLVNSLSAVHTLHKSFKSTPEVLQNIILVEIPDQHKPRAKDQSHQVYHGHVPDEVVAGAPQPLVLYEDDEDDGIKENADDPDEEHSGGLDDDLVDWLYVPKDVGEGVLWSVELKGIVKDV